MTPVAAHALIAGATLVMRALVVSEDGQRILRETGAVAPADAATLGRQLAEKLLEQGAAEMVALTPRDR